MSIETPIKKQKVKMFPLKKVGKVEPMTKKTTKQLVFSIRTKVDVFESQFQ